MVAICQHWGRQGSFETILTVKDEIFTDTGLDDIARLSEQLKASRAIWRSLGNCLGSSLQYDEKRHL
jgi:hypothetical protein